jgi:hypothetical protein
VERRRRLAATALVAAIGIGVLAGCAGSPAPAATANPSILGADFSTKALAACEAAHLMKQDEGPFPFPDFNPTKPDVSKLGAVADYLEKTAATYDAWWATMKALGEPVGGGTAWTALLAAIDRHGQLTKDQIAAARSGDTTRFAADYDSGEQTQAALLRAASDAGIPDCAKVDR